ncbi:MAG: sulfatase-like hydrolase/transferase, partial [Eubacteriales bacterium]|nr:sulfatase-like hydrolase/transferase [Eubacteriales bacterium]
MKEKLKTNLLIPFFLTALYITELTAVYVTSGDVYIRHPWVFIGISLFYTAVLYLIRNQKARYITGIIMLVITGIADTGFVLLFKMTETLFEFPMVNLRGEAVSIFDSLDIDFSFVFIFGTCLACFVVFGRRILSALPKPPKFKNYTLTASVCIIGALAFNMLAVEIVRPFKEVRDDMLYGNRVNAYSELGISGNLLYELANGIFTKTDCGDFTSDELEAYIYDADSVYYSSFPENTEKRYNVITILCESLEWFSFIQDSEKYPNGYNLENPDVLKTLFPNLYRFYGESVVMDNFHSREKTDIAENISLLGAYPTEAFINYSFPSNNISTSLINNLKTIDGGITYSYFHNGYAMFYNRDEYMKNLGFDNVVFGDDMAEKEGFTDWADKSERNLDSQMIQVCKEEMFPADTRFYTYITTITMHGVYAYRENLYEEGYYDALAAAGAALSPSGDTDYDTFIYYCAAVMEFDKALGEIYDYLEENDLLDSTIIALFGDHNTFYQGLSKYVKNTSDTSL